MKQFYIILLLGFILLQGCKKEEDVYTEYKARPTIFTPNGDGLNKLFYPKVSRNYSELTDYNIDISDFYGHIVFSSKDMFEGWNGKVNNTGAMCPVGIYFYCIKIEYASGEKEKYTGTVEIAMAGW